MTQDKVASVSLAGLSDDQRRRAMDCFAVLGPHLDDDVSLAAAARYAGVPIRTAERWLARYREAGLAGLVRPIRSDARLPRLPVDLVTLIEGMGLKRPRASAAAIHRRVKTIAKAQGWPVPSYSTVYAILARLDPAMVTLAHDGAAAFRDRYEARSILNDRGRAISLLGSFFLLLAAALICFRPLYEHAVIYWGYGAVAYARGYNVIAAFNLVQDLITRDEARLLPAWMTWFSAAVMLFGTAAWFKAELLYRESCIVSPGGSLSLTE
jgi:hypothetical protein